MQELLKVRTDEIKRVVVKSESVPVFVYENGRRTSEIKGYKQDVIMIENSKSPVFMKDFSVIFTQNYNFKKGSKIEIIYDDENCKVYATTKKESTFAQINVSLVALSARLVNA